MIDDFIEGALKALLNAVTFAVVFYLWVHVAHMPRDWALGLAVVMVLA